MKNHSFKLSNDGSKIAFINYPAFDVVLNIHDINKQITHKFNLGNLLKESIEILQLFFTQDSFFVFYKTKKNYKFCKIDIDLFKMQTIDFLNGINCKVFYDERNIYLISLKNINESHVYILSQNNFIEILKLNGRVDKIFSIGEAYYFDLKTPDEFFKIYKYNSANKDLRLFIGISNNSNERIYLANKKYIIFTTDINGYEQTIIYNFSKNEYKVANTNIKTDQRPIKLTDKHLYINIQSGTDNILQLLNCNNYNNFCVNNDGVILNEIVEFNNYVYYLKSTPYYPYTLFRCNLITFVEEKLFTPIKLSYKIGYTVHKQLYSFEKHTVECIVYQPKSANKGVIYYLHGGPYSRWTYQFNLYCNLLSNHGFKIICPNYRGSIGYGRKYRDIINKHWGEYDLIDIVNIVKEENYKFNIIIGESYGAFLALRLAIFHSEIISKCCLISGFISPLTLYEKSSNKNIKQFLLEKAINDENIEYSLTDYAKIKSKLYVTHGLFDSIVNISESRALINNLECAGKKSGKDFIYREINNSHSILNDEENEISNVLNFILEF